MSRCLIWAACILCGMPAADANSPLPLGKKGPPFINGYLKNLRLNQFKLGFESHYIRTAVGKRRTPAYIFDYHNLAYFSWVEASRKGFVEPNAMVVHVDTHGDEGWPYLPPPELAGLTSEQVYEYAANDLRVWDFIGAGIESGLIERMVWASPTEDRSQAYEQLGTPVSRWPLSSVDRVQTDIPHELVGIHSQRIDRAIAARKPSQVILDLDVDYFADLLAWGRRSLFRERLGISRDTPVDKDAGSPKELRGLLEADVKRIRELANRAGLVTIATSPGFIGQTAALGLLHKIFPEAVGAAE